MCTYDYTPYRGCERGQQHYYLQWMRCNKALENGNKYCPLDQSIEVEDLKKLSGNVIFCPMHNPISVQQHEFLFLFEDDHDRPTDKSSQTDQMRSRSQSTRGRPVTAYRPEIPRDNSARERVRKTDRKKVPRNVSPPPTPDSEPEDPIPRPRTASGVKRLDDDKVVQDRKSLARTRSHRRVSSVEFGSLPTVKVTRPRASDDASDTRKATEDTSIPEQDESGMTLKNPHGPLSPGMRARLGLPASPDMHRRNTVAYRSRSESPFKLPEYHLPNDGPATDPEFGHPLFFQDGSAEQKLEAFANQQAVRRAKTSRSARTSEERIMRRIVEDKKAEEELPRSMPSPKRAVRMTFLDHEPEPEHLIGLGLQHTERRSVSRAKSEAALSRSGSPEPRLDASPPQRRRKYVRVESRSVDAPLSHTESTYTSIKTTPEQPATNNQVSPHVHAAVRASRTAPNSDNEEDSAAFLHRKREARKSRRYEDQVEEAKRWAAAREQHFSSPVSNVAGYDRNYYQSPPEPVWASPGSNDSGYLSGHHHQQQQQQQQGQQQQQQLPQRRKTLHKTQPSATTTASTSQSDSSTFDMDVRHIQRYVQLQQRQPVAMKQEVVHVTALPQDAAAVVAAAGEKNQAKTSLLKKMGLKRKISSLWERNGSPVAAI